MSEVKTEAGKWLLAEYARTPGDPKWYPGLGLDSTIIAIEMQAAEAALAAHDCFFDGQPARPERAPQDIAALHLDMTDEEADAFLAAIEEQQA